MNAYLRIDSYTATEKLIASYILQDSATANIRFPIYWRRKNTRSRIK